MAHDEARAGLGGVVVVTGDAGDGRAGADRVDQPAQGAIWGSGEVALEEVVGG